MGAMYVTSRMSVRDGVRVQGHEELEGETCSKFEAVHLKVWTMAQCLNHCFQFEDQTHDIQTLYHHTTKRYIQALHHHTNGAQ